MALLVVLEKLSNVCSLSKCNKICIQVTFGLNSLGVTYARL